MPLDDFRLGVLMLDTRFPRFPGEIGHAETFPFPVDYERVPGAVVSRVVSGKASCGRSSTPQRAAWQTAAPS